MRTAVWSLWAIVFFYGCCQAVDEGERRGGRKRNRGTGASAFRPEQTSPSNHGRNLPMPDDPLFTDQREIRLSFPKERLWSSSGSVDSSRKKATTTTSHNNKKKPSKSSGGGHSSDNYFGSRKTGSESSTKTNPKKPNIILIVTDDQDVELGSLDYMPKTRAILKEGGAFFPNSFVSTPMCCPSRSSMLTGLFVHNHGVLTNTENCSSAYWQAEHEPRTFGAYLASAGYRTGYFGKYLNKYNGSYVPPGWRVWAGQVMNSRYYNYTINFNGQKIKHGADYQTDYYPDLITNDSISFLRESKQHYDHQPFHLVMSFPSPHGPEDSAPQYADMFFNVTRHRTPSYDFAPNPDKQWILRWLGKMKPVHHRFTDLLMTKRLQTLQSVDEAVEKIFSELVALGQLENTYIFYTSDHGYHLGQFGLIKGKSFPFESDIRVPFLVRGPGVGRGRVVQSLIGNVDLAPTFLEIAGVPVPPHMDGASIFRFFQKEKVKSRTPWRDTYLIERGKMPPAHFPKLNVVEDVPNSNEGAEGDDADGVSVEYSPPRGKFERWAVECRKPQYQSPCSGFQKYECLFVDERWRMKKCRTSVQPHHKLAKKKWCQCKALSKYRLSKLEPEERRMQRAFLKEHTRHVDWRGYRPRFLKTVAGKKKFHRNNNRHKREEAAAAAAAATAVETAASSAEGSVLRDVAEDELEQVELIMEDISDEISDLEALTEARNVSSNTKAAILDPVTVAPSTAAGSPSGDDKSAPQLNNSDGKLNCQIVGQSRINCSSEVYSDPATWRLSRDFLEQQIRILRVQLDELKVIRKHLRAMRPMMGGDKSYSANNKRASSKTTGSSLFDWSSPPSKRTELNSSTGASDLAGSVGRRKHRPKIAQLTDDAEDDHEEEEVVDEDDDDEDEDESTADPVESTIEVTIYDNRKIKPSNNAGRIGMCPCVDVNWSSRSREARKEERLIRQANRRKIKEERQKRRQKKLSRKRAMIESHNGQCSYEKMNCFSHDKDHWRTAPLWNDGPFCVCMNANNNTYWCVRTLNTTHNSLYCEFITGFVTYYDMRIDPYQLRNIAHTLSENQLAFFHQTLEKLRVCKGADCFVNTHPSAAKLLSATNDGGDGRASKSDPEESKNASYHLQSSHVLDNGRLGKVKPRRDGYWRRSKRRERQTPDVIASSNAAAAV